MKNIIISGASNSGKSKIVCQFFDELWPLVNIHGFRLVSLNGPPDSYELHFFSRPSLTFKLTLNSTQLFSEVLNELLNELSIFQMVDLFLLDELGVLEGFLPRLQQQILTIFASKIPVIAAVNSGNISSINYLLNRFDHKLIDLDQRQKNGKGDLFLELLRELYDR